MSSPRRSHCNLSSWFNGLKELTIDHRVVPDQIASSTSSGSGWVTAPNASKVVGSNWLRIFIALHK
jgi:hypothetical protein